MPKLHFVWRFAIATSVAVASIAGCTKASTPTTPDMNPPPSVTVPVQPDLVNQLDPSNVAPPPAVAPPVALPPAPLAAPLGAPLLGMTVGTPVPLIPFVSKFDRHYKLFVYDRTIADNYALPGAGEDVNNPSLFSNSRIVFDRDGKIFFYDVVSELLVSFNDVNGLGLFVSRPSITFDGTVMTFVGKERKRYGDGYSYEEEEYETDGDGYRYHRAGKAFIWINGVVADLAKVNAVGFLHEGITWIRISCDGRWAVFTTGDGRLFVYDVINPMVHEVTDAQDVGGRHRDATHPAISPDGTQIAFEKGGSLFRYDRIADLIDPMPFLNLAFNNDFATDPLFLCWDNAHIYAEVRIDDYKWRVVEYNWITETIAGLTILNNVFGDGSQLISDKRD